MTLMKLTRFALAGATLLLAAATIAPSQAGPAAPAAPQSMVAQTDGSNLLDVGYYGGHRGYRRGYRHHGGGFRFFFAAPVIVNDGYYGGGYRSSYGGGPSCYSICRDYHGPEFCRYNWRRYC